MHDISYLRDILILLFASVAIVVVFKQFGLSPALGYLVSGAAIGPFGFGVLTSGETTKSIAELGIVFLLFAIGLELTFGRLMAMRKYVLGFGSLQVILTSALIYFICHEFCGLTSEASIIIGSALSLSSTAIVMQVITENSEETTRVGRLSFSILLMQDLAVIPILVLLPVLAKEDVNITHALGTAFIDAMIAMAIIFMIGRSLLRPIYRIIAESKNEVLFLSFTLIVILGSAYLSNYMGLSFALGAFVAGLMVAETEYKYRVEEEILSLKSLLMGLFFMTIGMSFDFDLLIKSFPFIVAAAVALIIAKTLIVIILCRVFRFPLAPSIHAGLLLAQGGEFAFVVFVMAVQQKFMEPDLSQFLMTVVTFSMALTPLLASIGRQLKSRLYIKSVLRDNKIKREIGDISKHVIIIGFTKVGRIVAYILRKRGINYLVIDNNHRLVRIEKSNGYNIYYGDAMNADILRHIGIERSESVIITMEDEISCLKITRFIHENFPNVSIVAKSENVNNAERFKKVGANLVVSKNLETGLQLSKAAMLATGINNSEIDSTIDSFRDIHSEIIRDVILYSEIQEEAPRKLDDENVEPDLIDGNAKNAS
ncbi:MAG: cation:proton antiporter [Rickettsiales bacterium]|nr:cation:proton antiporter [Rickettsiales bacterium]